MSQVLIDPSREREREILCWNIHSRHELGFLPSQSMEALEECSKTGETCLRAAI